MHEKIEREEIKREICVFISDSAPESDPPMLSCIRHVFITRALEKRARSRSLIDNKPRDALWRDHSNADTRDAMLSRNKVRRSR